MKSTKVKPTSREELNTLILTIGGETALLRILERFYSSMKNDPMIGYFFEGKPIHEIAGKQAEFILMAAGLRKHFQGKGPASAHTALPPIYSGHFDRRLVVLRETLKLEGLTPETIEIWLRFEESFRAVVVSD